MQIVLLFAKADIQTTAQIVKISHMIKDLLSVRHVVIVNSNNKRTNLIVTFLIKQSPFKSLKTNFRYSSNNLHRKNKTTDELIGLNEIVFMYILTFTSL